jgi:hypothetical protein
MPPRKDDDFMDVDSDSDISIPDDGDDHVTRKGKGKAKASDKRKRDKGKGKAKDAVSTSSCHQSILSRDFPSALASIYMGSVIYALMGHSPRGRSRESAKFS